MAKKSKDTEADRRARALPVSLDSWGATPDSGVTPSIRARRVLAGVRVLDLALAAAARRDNRTGRDDAAAIAEAMLLLLEYAYRNPAFPHGFRFESFWREVGKDALLVSDGCAVIARGLWPPEELRLFRRNLARLRARLTDAAGDRAAAAPLVSASSTQLEGAHA
ncbi:hypothetical protein [Elioraea sp.]|uniref:hypothetical protein n=1 Tax=Elioraea sp. TaxID=2185103 RepID=UPI003F6E8BEC